MNRIILVYVAEGKGTVLFASTICTLEKRIQNFHKKHGTKSQCAKNITINSTIKEMIIWLQRILQFGDGLKKIIG